LICLVWLFIPCCFSCTVFTKRKFTISSLTASMLIVLICYQKGDLFTAHIFLSDSFIWCRADGITHLIYIFRGFLIICLH
jgi:hypothetical protein